MSEVKLNLVDSEQILHGTVHGSLADRAVAALSAEPETIRELEVAMERFKKPSNGCPFSVFSDSPSIDEELFDAGIVIIDLTARVVATESSYSCPGKEGQVNYHDGFSQTDGPIFYRLPDDWLFVTSVEDYNCCGPERAAARKANPPLDARAVLYGRPFFLWIAETISNLDPILADIVSTYHFRRGKSLEIDDDESQDSLENLRDQISTALASVHASWLMTPRGDLRGLSPRAVMLEKRDFIDFDLHSRSLQWSMQQEGPPCLSKDSFAYRYAGFGTHEWVIYYDLVRQLLWSAASSGHLRKLQRDPKILEAEVSRLEDLAKKWLEESQPDYSGRVPAVLLESERKRLPIAMNPKDMIVDPDCPACNMMADEASMGMGPGFWHLDGSHMEDDFAFSEFHSKAEWEEEQRRYKEFHEQWEREWAEQELSHARRQMVATVPMTDSEPC